MAKPKPKARQTSTSSKPKPRPRVARPGDNSLEGRAQPYLKRIETKLDDLESLRGRYMTACKVVREDIREIYAEGVDHGVAKRALKALVEYRVLERRQAKLANDFDIDEQAAYVTLVQALGPLGMAAAKAAGFLPDNEQTTGNGEDRDVRPRHMTQPGAQADEPAPRADEAELARVGRGPDAPAEPPAQTQ